MALFRIAGEGKLTHTTPATLQTLDLRKKQNLQTLLRNYAKAIDPALLIAAEEFGNWQDSNL